VRDAAVCGAADVLTPSFVAGRRQQKAPSNQRSPGNRVAPLSPMDNDFLQSMIESGLYLFDY
jgi:hypothetical protein